MVDKFPSLTDSKQRIFSLDVARFASTESGELALVVAAERERFTLFWSQPDGTWSSRVVTHDALSLTPRRPDRSHAFGWSPRIGIASGPGQVGLVYKRRFNSSARDDLHVQLFDFNETTRLFGAGQRIAIPRAGLGIARFGFCAWADVYERSLIIVAQAFFANAGDAPQLVLLRTPFPVADAETLADAASWTVTTLDRGGWDFGARREGARLAVVHRRVAAAYGVNLARPLDPGFAPSRITFSDDAGTTPRLSDLATASLVLVEIDLDAAAVVGIDEAFPFGEIPHIHRLDPFIATVDRMRTGLFTIGGAGIRWRWLRWTSMLVMRVPGGLRAAPLFAEARDWPHYLDTFARIHEATGVGPSGVNDRPFRLEFGSLWSTCPVALFGVEPSDKGTLLTFAHPDEAFSALRATVFRVAEDAGGDALLALPEGYSILDLAHRRVRPPRGDEDVEHEQFRPHDIAAGADHEDGPRIVRQEDPANTFTGALVAADEAPATFYAYTERGDGGVRVVFDARLTVPPPAAPADQKTFTPVLVPEPEEDTRAWVRIATPNFRDTNLPGYLSPPTLLTPNSLACDLQQALDGLALQALNIRDSEEQDGPLPGGGRIRFRDGGDVGRAADIELLELAEDTALNIQRDTEGDVPPPEPVQSSRTQPFTIEIRSFEGLRFANMTFHFRGIVVNDPNEDDPDQAAYTFEWEFSDGGTETGRDVERSFAATLPDFSRAEPGEETDDVEITLRVTAPDGRVSEVKLTFPLPASLWATLWDGYSGLRRPPQDSLDELAPGLFVRDGTLSFFRYSLQYLVNEDAEGTRVVIHYRRTHRGAYRCRGSDTGQGDVEYEVRVHAVLSNVRLTGALGSALGAVVRIDNIDAVFPLRRRFTIGVQTSERRNRDAASETMVTRFPFAVVPSALACVPVGETEPLAPTIAVTSGLTDAARNVTVLVAALTAAGLAGIAIAVLIPILIFFASGALLITIITGGLGAILGALVLALGAFVVLSLVEWLIVRPAVENAVRQALSGAEVADALAGAGLFTHAGEGLAEAVAREVIAQARRDGHEVAPVEDFGRERFRSPFFDTIVVGTDEAKVKIDLSGRTA